MLGLTEDKHLHNHTLFYLTKNSQMEDAQVHLIRSDFMGMSIDRSPVQDIIETQSAGEAVGVVAKTVSPVQVKSEGADDFAIEDDKNASSHAGESKLYPEVVKPHAQRRSRSLRTSLSRLRSTRFFSKSNSSSSSLRAKLSRWNKSKFRELAVATPEEELV